MAHQNGYEDMKCVIYFGEESKQRWLGFQQKRAELAGKCLQKLSADELKRIRTELAEEDAGLPQAA